MIILRTYIMGPYYGIILQVTSYKLRASAAAATGLKKVTRVGPETLSCRHPPLNPAWSRRAVDADVRPLQVLYSPGMHNVFLCITIFIRKKAPAAAIKRNTI